LAICTKEKPQIPDKSFSLFQNYPNPFNSSTTIRFQTYGSFQDITLQIYDICGKSVRKFFLNELDVGNHRVNWNGKSESGKHVASGTYFYTIEINNQVSAKRMIFNK